MSIYRAELPSVVRDKGEGLRVLNRHYRILEQAAGRVAIKVVIRTRA